MNSIYETYYNYYEKNMVSLETLNKLVAAGKLTQGEVDAMVEERKDKFGY